uniref:Uncharacterized protein n=1 Tax=Tanacetum cinerariifolium TaxID=118510 RepID=A0A6L2J8S9_TANCI|nr:hypothetical protein [Tanacetum cinerariifolium]
MSQPPNEPGYFTHLLNSNPQQYSSSLNQSNPSTTGSQNSISSSQPFPPFGAQMSPDQGYQSQLSYYQQQPYDFQNFANPRNTPQQYSPSQSLQPQIFSQQQSQPSQPQFKVPQAKDPRDGRRKQKKTRKQPVVDLDEDDDDDMAARRGITHNLQELFGPDPRERPAGKQRAPKKQKSVDTSSTGGSTGGSQSESVSLLVSQDYRRKCAAAERAYKAKREKEVAMMQCRELEFLLFDPSTLPPAKRAIIEKKQAEIMSRFPNA